jgi:hypothetical protein
MDLKEEGRAVRLVVWKRGGARYAVIRSFGAVRLCFEIWGWGRTEKSYSEAAVSRTDRGLGCLLR